ncbi:hypothetical protein Ais01nite_03880 [Asanoa ishikariensis]|uniref:Uncharacterized protein n=1 Tax=Asanoa ishikariensis TaxID=137265 RepID=A0A1H3TIH4_9ACTN|nr:hypothetical protein [Asanoa ishikariensis]GIF62353.1 hypothetical protein Ais01nite_03880 [Asanoa ishikariensis]SDZ50122.1 hypothetical protein SAMN05421684_5843 [Asanoa ishikariensis]
MPTFEELRKLNELLPDPSTLLFDVRLGERDDPAGRRGAVEHWAFLAGRKGYTVTPRDARSEHTAATYCGEVDVDGLGYEVHRGPRRRLVEMSQDAAGTSQGRFVLGEAIWAVPVPPEPEPVYCPWCTDGPPDTFRLAGSSTNDGIFSVWAVENADGTGRGLVVQQDPDEDEPDTVCFEPAHAVLEAGVRGWTLSTDELALHFTDEAAGELDLADGARWLRFQLSLKPAQHRKLRAGLEKVFGPAA